MKNLVIDFRVNQQNSDYACKMYYKCSNLEQLKAAKVSLNSYLDMKIREAENELDTRTI